MSVSDIVRKTRLKPYALLLLLVAVVAVAYVALGAALLREHQKQSELSSQIDSAEAVLAAADDVQQDMKDLPGRLAATRQKLTAAQAAFPSELDSNNILKTVMELAHKSQIRVISVDAPSPAVEPTQQPTKEPTQQPTEEPTEDTSNGDTLSFNIQVEGNLGQLIAFLGALEEGSTSTTRVSTFAFQEADGRYLLDIELLAFARSATSEASSPKDESSTGEGTEATSDGQETPTQ